MLGLAFVSILLFSCLCWVLGVRLLRMAQQRRELPELAMAGCMLGIGALGYPSALVAQVGGPESGAVGFAAFAASVVSVDAGIFSVFLFTRHVFRRGSSWSLALVLTAGALLLLEAVGLVGQAWSIGLQVPPDDLGHAWTLLVFSLSIAGFGWSALESLRYYAMQRRRLALGLGSAVVANRFLLWGVSGLSVTAGTLLNLAYLLAGLNFLLDPLPLTGCALLGLLNTGCLYLAFLPPVAYQDWLRRATPPAHSLA